MGSVGGWEVNEYLIKSIFSTPRVGGDKYLLTLLTLRRLVCTLVWVRGCAREQVCAPKPRALRPPAPTTTLQDLNFMIKAVI